jgi:hypothetical protein
VVAAVYVVWANRSYKPPLALTRCLTCVGRREDGGEVPDLHYDPTLAVDPLSGSWFSKSHEHTHRHAPGHRCEDENDHEPFSLLWHRSNTIQEGEPFEPLLPVDDGEDFKVRAASFRVSKAPCACGFWEQGQIYRMMSSTRRA